RPERAVCSGIGGGCFFQAEDGIRDRNVTGVQTCALPISPAAARGQEGTLGPAAGVGQLDGRQGPPLVDGIHRLDQGGEKGLIIRSEERRVGKGCRWRWAAAGCSAEGEAARQ